MKVKVHPFWLPKAGNTEDEYEDAFWPNGPVNEAAAPFHLAVADGASTTSFSGLWARLLVEAYGTGAIAGQDLDAALQPLREHWLAIVGTKNLPWHAAEKVRRGAFSSLLGLSFAENGRAMRGRWTSLAIGDSCLIHMRGNAVQLTFPLNCSEQFQANPYLIGSKPDGLLGADHACVADGVWESSDVFYLMTDALACWFIKAAEGSGRPWSLLEPLAGSEKGALFENLVVGLRESNSLRNDDVTFVRVAVSA